LGYEDLNDHDSLRKDLAWQTGVERDSESASSPTLCRLEARGGRRSASAMHRVLIEQFIASFATAPEELILEFDAEVDRVHGLQQGRSFHAYYGDWCFFPLYMFCGEQLLGSYLRPGNIDAARHSWAILKLLVIRLREAFPRVRLVLRADSGFSRWKILRWCERRGVDYLVGLAKNSRLLAFIKEPMAQAAEAFAKSSNKERHFGWIDYAAATWDRERRVINKAEQPQREPTYAPCSLAFKAIAKNFTTPVTAPAARWRTESRNNSSAFFCRPHFGPLLMGQPVPSAASSAAYVFLETILRLGLAGSDLARAQASTIRLKLLKVGAVILRNTRWVRLFFSSAYPYRDLWLRALGSFNSA